jgi:hypothetical protein
VYLSRFINWQFNNSPYLSGDTFSDLADGTFSRSKFRIRDWRKSLKDSEVIFLSGDDTEEFFSQIENFPKAKILLIGNSDRDWTSFDFQVPSRIRKIYLQNNFVNSSKFKSLPIGIENRRLGVNGLPSRFVSSSRMLSTHTRCCEKPLLTYLSPTHESRNTLSSFVDDFHYFPDRLTPDEYLLQIARHKYVICPRGNGIDTHRFWEALYLNSHPIVVQSTWSELISEQMNLPIIEVKDWHLVKETIEKLDLEEFSSKTIPSLWFRYWENLIKKDL